MHKVSVGIVRTVDGPVENTTINELNPKVLAWLERRGLDPMVVVAMQTYSGRLDRSGAEAEVVPDAKGSIMVFPFFEDGVEVNCKYRTHKKQMWQRKGGRKTFYNADILNHPDLESGKEKLVIVEGEPDCLAVLTAKYQWVVSVPDGAPPARDNHGRKLPPVPHNANDIDPEHDDKYSYIFNNWEKLESIKHFVLFTDADEPGERLREELARRIGRVRCDFVTYPEGCKDANEVLLRHGRDKIVEMIQAAKPIPVRGIYHLSDFPDYDQPTMYSTGWCRLDVTPNMPAVRAPATEPPMQLMVTPGMFMVVLGRPGSGKSTWTLQLANNLARLHDWNVGIASFEMPAVPYVRDIMRHHHIGMPRPNWDGGAVRAADTWINRRFTFIHSDARTDDEDPTLEWLIDRASDAVVRDGIRVLLIDPWNEIEHCKRRDETESQYTNRAIRALKRFGSSYNVLVIVVVHPTKAGGLTDGPLDSLYHADGSAAWVNKPDIGIIVERDLNPLNNISTIRGCKFRFRQLGSKGVTTFAFDPMQEMYAQ